MPPSKPFDKKCTKFQAWRPFLINLTKTEKRKGFKMGKKTEKFFYDTLKVTEQSPQYVPLYININEYGKDFELFLALQQTQAKLAQLSEAVGDTRKAVEQECM